MMTLTPSSLDDTKKKQRLLSIVLKIASAVLVISSIPEFLYWIPNSLILLTIILALFGISYYINKKGHTNMAANILIICLSALIFIQTQQLGPRSYVQVFYLPIIISIPFIIENRKQWLMLLHLAHILFFCTISYILDNSNLFLQPSSEYIYFNGPLNMACSIIMCGFFVWIMVQDNNKSNRLLLESQLKLQDQNNELIKTNRELDHLVYSISHDLRAPIASALGLIELAKTEEDPKQLQYYENLKESCLKRLDSFIIDILNYLKNNRLSVTIEEINIKTEIDFAVNMNSTFNQDINIITNLEYTDNFHTDRNRLRIILNNLISNALRHTRSEEEGKQIHIRSQLLNNEVVISIKDNGTGIHPQHLHKIFEMFFKSSENSKGSGLGLYITKEALEKIQGHIEVHSQKGIGSTFTIYLPNLNDQINPNYKSKNITYKDVQA